MQIILFIWMLSHVAIGANPICVRDYKGPSGERPCAMEKSYVWVATLDEEKERACTRNYSNFYCENAKEFEWVESTDRKRVCVLNNNQPPVANLCFSTPEFYAYIKPAP